MQVKLKLLTGTRAGQEIAVPGPRFRIGRDASCQLRAKSDAIAEAHCEVQVEPGAATLVDLDSATGTFLNGKRLSGSSPLKAGDRFRVGPLEFGVEIIIRVAGTKKPKVNSVEEAAARMAGAGGADDLDIDSLLNGDDAGTAPSRYAAQLTPDEIAALGTGGGQAKPSSSPAKSPPSNDNTRDKAADALNKMHRNR
ncbi:MAG: FHA domain-containing protein [Planctomycetes bacterium]|nr:FHA domain-containing protein [Planctomycetota bacterium]